MLSNPSREAKLFFSAADSDQAQTHALIIGVGGYPHVADGEDPKPKVANEFGTLTQLTSAPRSAARFAEWIVECADAWDAPLGSVDLLISPVPGDDFAVPTNADGSTPALPTLGNVKTAYIDWKKRCGGNKDNIALFYFCGHGGEKGVSMYLLCRDFGAAENIWEGAFDFRRARDSFHTCAAERQFFFVDACRELTLGLLLIDPTPASLEGSRRATDPDCRFNFTQFSAPRNAPAMGPVKGVSFYATALMQAMGGAAAKNVAGDWIVTTGRIVDTLEEIARMQELPEDYNPRFDRDINETARILHVPTPKVPVTISCIPEEDNAHVVAMACQRFGMAQDEWPHKVSVAPWTLELPAVIHVIKAELDDKPGAVMQPFSPVPPNHPEAIRTR